MFRYIAKYNIHLGLAAVISGISYSMYFDTNIDIINSIKIIVVQFFAVIAAYNYFRKRIKITWQIPLVVVIATSFLLNFNIQISIFLAGLLSFLYQLPLKSKLGLRYHPFLKPATISLCWTIIVLLHPIILNNNIVFDNKFIVYFFLKFLEIAALCVANDLLHIPKDKLNGVKTFPIAYGLTVTKISVLLLAIFQFLFPLFIIYKIKNSNNGNDFVANSFYVSMILSYFLVLVSILLIQFKKNKGVEYLLDVIVGIEALFFILINYKMLIYYFNF